jgi:predicted outer membrane repeat protein
MCKGSSPRIADCVIQGCAAERGGGLFCCEGDPLLERCTFDGNTAAQGGAACCETGSLTVSGCTVTANRGGSGGGGFLAGPGASVTMTNCLVAGNTAETGGGLRCEDGAALLVNCTLSGNRASAGSGVFGAGKATAELLNTIVWNAGGNAIGGSGTTASYSCIEEASVRPGDGNMNVDPAFFQGGGWDDNGTPDDPADDTWIPGDYALRSHSPAIDAGTVAGAPAVDIAGNPRPANGVPDLGAYEYRAPRFRRGDANADGAVNLADPVFTMSFLFANGPAPPCREAVDTNDDGSMDIGDAIRTLFFLFASGEPPPEPHAGCGFDPTPDSLGCASYPPCP